MEKLRDTYIRIMLTLVIAWVYGILWCVLELLIDGEITNRLVDSIIMLLFIPIIYVSTKNIVKNNKQ